MKLKTLIAITLLLLSLPAAVAFPADSRFSGEIEATGEAIDVRGNKAKFSEYRDMVNEGGLYSNIRLGYDTDNYWLKFRASDVTYDTQYYQLGGGMYGKFKYDLFYNEIVHNITFGAITPYSGAGGNALTYSGAAPNRDPSTWNSFDYKIKRRQFGGGFDIDMLKPFYLDLSATRENRSGKLPVGAGTGMNHPISFIELPSPVHYSTSILSGEVGYASKPFVAAVNYLYSSFINDNQILNYESIVTPSTDRTALPPNNHYFRVGFKGSAQLPLNTRFNVNVSNAQEKSRFDLLTSYILLEPPASLKAVDLTAAPNSLGSTLFRGRKDIENYALVLTSNPAPFLDGKVFYKYYNVHNKSDQITTVDLNNSTTAFAPGFDITNDVFDYRRSSYGVDLGFRLPARFYLDTAYTYVDVHRNRFDLRKTKDNIYSAGLRWSGLDFLMPKIGYERLQRSTAGLSEDALSENFGVEKFFRRFDVAKQHGDTYKVAVDLFPLDNLNLGVAYKYRKSIFPETILGQRNSRTNELDFYGDYTLGSLVKLNAYFDMQDVKTHTFLRYFNSTAGSRDPNPDNPSYFNRNGVNLATAFNWDMSVKDRTYDYGAGADFYIVPKKLTLRVQYDYVNSNGFDDLTLSGAGLSFVGAAANNSNVDISNFDDYRKSAFTGKVIYDLSRFLSVAVGAAFEHYRYNDTSFDNYQNFFTSATGTPYFLSGAYSNPSYNASIVFATVAYKF